MREVHMTLHETPVRTDHEDRIFMNGYVYGKREGAKALIEMLQSDINDCGQMTDAHKIKMHIFNAWKTIYCEGTNFTVSDTETGGNDQ